MYAHAIPGQTPELHQRVRFFPNKDEICSVSEFDNTYDTFYELSLKMSSHNNLNTSTEKESPTIWKE